MGMLFSVSFCTNNKTEVESFKMIRSNKHRKTVVGSSQLTGKVKRILKFDPQMHTKWSLLLAKVLEFCLCFVHDRRFFQWQIEIFGFIWKQEVIQGIIFRNSVPVSLELVQCNNTGFPFALNLFTVRRGSERLSNYRNLEFCKHTLQPL